MDHFGATGIVIDVITKEDIRITEPQGFTRLKGHSKNHSLLNLSPPWSKDLERVFKIYELTDHWSQQTQPILLKMTVGKFQWFIP